MNQKKKDDLCDAFLQGVYYLSLYYQRIYLYYLTYGLLLVHYIVHQQ